MKVLALDKTQKNKDINFEGMKQAKTKFGRNSYEFYLPYDTDRYNAVLEITRLVKDDKLEWIKPSSAKVTPIELNGNKISINPDKYFMLDDAFGYRFKLVDKENAQILYHQDAGVGTSGFTVVARNRAGHNKKGQMMHIVPDSYNPGYYFDKFNNFKLTRSKNNQNTALNATRTHFNQMGGNIAGIIQNIGEIKKMGIKNVLTTPIFGMDELSSHGYWTTNPYHVSTQMGTREDFRNLQVELFKNNMNLVADGAFVNEGLEGMHFKSLLRWREKSPFAHWFKTYVPNDTSLHLGVLPNVEKDSEVLKNIKLRVVNPAGEFNYKKAHTYAQLYDKRLVDEKKLDESHLIRRYDKLNTDNQHEIYSHNDSVIPYAFEVDPEKFARSLRQNAKKFDKDSIEYIKAVMKSQNMTIGAKRDGGFYSWDGNVDIAKLNYMYSPQDDAILTRLGASVEEKQKYELGGIQVQDYIQNVASFWTKETKNTLIAHAAKSYANSISDLPDNHNEIVNDEIKQVIKDNKYKFPKDSVDPNDPDYIVKKLSEFPLESIEFGADVSAIFASPYISSRPFSKEDVGKSRFEMNGKDLGYSKIPAEYRDVYKSFDDLFFINEAKNKGKKKKDVSDIKKVADDIIEVFNKQNPEISLTNEDGSLSEAGKFIFPLISNDIMKFIVVNTIAPGAIYTKEDDSVHYDYDSLKLVTLRSLEISASSPKEEAEKIVQKFNWFIHTEPSEDFAKDLAKRFKNVKLDDVKKAYALVDRSESGLNWRIDATKDVADIDFIRDENTDIQAEWDTVIDFWKGFAQNIRKENPNSYIIAEMTDMDEFWKASDPADEKNPINYNYEDYIAGDGKYLDNNDAETKFVQETGMSTLSNYSTFYTPILGLEGKPSDPKSGGRLSQDNIQGALQKNIKTLLGSSMVNAAKHSHNFFSNHDKPRVLHVLSVDMDLYHHERLNNDSTVDDERISGLINEFAPNLNKGDIDFKALATAEVLSKAFQETTGYFDDKYKHVLKDYVSGKFGNPESFGTKPFEKIVAETLENAGFENQFVKNITDSMLINILKPATEKYKRMLKLLTILPGNPTMYAGDELGMTGFEQPNKNIYVQNRNALDWSLVKPEDTSMDPPKKPVKRNEPEEIVIGKKFFYGDNYRNFIQEFYSDIEDIAQIREGAKTSNKALDALSTGETIVCDTYKNDKDDTDSIALLRYNEDSTLLCLATSVGSQKDIKKSPDKVNHHINSVKISKAGGIQPSSKFINAIDKNDKTVYKLRCDGEYFVDNIKMNDSILVLERVDNLPEGYTVPISFAGGSNFLKAKAYVGSHIMANDIETVTLY